jgi:hypothetical protein
MALVVEIFAIGSIDATGNLIGDALNVTAVTQFATGIYDIDLESTAGPEELSTFITARSSVQISASWEPINTGATVRVSLFDAAGALVDSDFDFVTYRVTDGN